MRQRTLKYGEEGKDRRDGLERARGELPENWIAGRNPIREALKAGRPLEKLVVAKGDLSGAAREIVRMARESGVVVQEIERARLDAMYPSHQGMIAYASAAAYSSVEEILAAAAEAGEAPFLVALDGITDPHNLGAIIRSAVLFGAHGVIVPKRRSAGLSPACEKAAAGALAYAKIARVTNLTQTIEGVERAWNLDSRSGRGWRGVFRGEAQRRHLPGHRFGRRGREPLGAPGLRFYRIHSHDGRD